MIRQKNPQSDSTPSQSVRRRIARIVFVVIVGIFVVVGLALLVGIRTTARDTLITEQAQIVAELQDRLNDEFDDAIDNTVDLAESQGARQFARETVTVASSQLQVAQQNMIAEMITLLRDNPDEYLRIRYVTRSGSVWTEIENDQNFTVDPSVYLNQLQDDASLRAALNLPPGQYAMSGIEFVRDATGTLVEPLQPFIRITTPVSTVDDATNVPGMIQLDMSITPMVNLVNNELTQMGLDVLEPGRRLVLVDNDGNFLADTDTPEATLPKRGTVVIELTDAQAQLQSVLSDAPTRFTSYESGGLLINRQQISVDNALSMPWSLMMVDNAALALGSADMVAVAALLVSVVVGAVLSLGTNSLLNRYLRPLDTVTQLAQQILGTETEDAVEHPHISAPEALETSDEFGKLFESFDQIANRFDRLNQDYTVQLAGYSRNLQIAARISRETATLRDTDELLNRAIDLICREFDFYHAQVYIVDDIGANAILRYSRGEVGRQLIASELRHVVGAASVIGQTTKTGTPVVVNDTEAPGSPHRFNPLLPETRAELAIPLQIGAIVIGALDVQSKSPNVFGEEEINIFQLLADQIAIAIYNARLLIESSDRYEQITRLNRNLTQDAWRRMGQEEDLSGVYTYDLTRVERKTLTETETEDPSQALASAISAPINIRGEVIGTLEAAPPEGEDFTSGDSIILRAVAERVALAIENARLFRETQSSLAQTSVLYEISRFLNAADTLEGIIAAIVKSVMPDAIAGQIGVFDDYDPAVGPEWMELTAEWFAAEGDYVSQEVQLPGIQLHFEDHVLLRQMKPNQVTLINDIQQDQRLDEVLQVIFMGIGARAAVLIPFSVLGDWRGVILVEFAEPREFTEREGSLYSTLIDQAGVAIDNRLLLQQTEMALSQIERLYAASRIINTAQSPQDLIRAAIASTSDPGWNFELGLFEGDLDATGWPSRLRVVARSLRGDIYEDNSIVPISITLESPLRHRDTQLVVDRNPSEPEEDATLVSFLRANGNRFGSVFPLFSANQPIALFFITATEIRELSADDYEIYRALTGQMSTVLQNRRLLEQTEDALDETRRLYIASRAIVGAPDAETVFRVAAEHLAGATPTLSQVSVLVAPNVYSPTTPVLEYAYIWSRRNDHTSAPGMLVNRDDVSFAQLFINAGGATAIFNDVENDLIDRPALLAALERDNASSTIIAPIQYRDQWFGMLLCTSDHRNAFGERDGRFAQAIASQVAIAVENYRLFTEAQAQARRALALAEAGRLASRMSGGFEERIAEVFEQIAEPANYDRWLLTLFDRSRQFLEVTVLHQPGDAPALNVDRFDLATSRHSLVDAARYDRMLLINTPQEYSAFNDQPVSVLEHVGKHLVTPVRVNDEIIGVLLVGRPLDAPDLDERDEQLVDTLSAQVGVAVENRRLFQAAETERQTLSTIIETLPAGVLVLDGQTYRPTQYNQEAEALLGQKIDLDVPFTVAGYRLYRTGTDDFYPQSEMPIFNAEKGSGQVDDVAVFGDDDYQTDLLIHAAPIWGSNEQVDAIIVAFSDISNLRSLENTLQDNLRETITMYTTTKALSQGATEDDIIAIVKEQMLTFAPSEGLILTLNADTSEISVTATLFNDLTTHPLPDALLDAEIGFQVGDVARDYRLDNETKAELTAAGIDAVVSIPLRASQRDLPLGWLVMIFDHVRPFAPEEERFLETLTDSTAVALDNRFLFRSTEAALQETAMLYEATTSMSRTRDLDEVSKVLQDSLQTNAPDFAAAYLIVTTEDSEETVELFNTNFTGGTVPDFRGLVEAHSHDLFDSGNIYINQLHEHEHLTPLELDLAKLDGVKAMSMVSLRIKGIPSGALFIGYQRPHQFDAGQRRFITALTDSASIIIDNILLLDQIQNTLEETSVLYQTSRALSDVTEPSTILEVVINHLIRSNTTIAFIGMLQGGVWDTPDASLLIESAWQRGSAESLDMTGLILTADQFPLWRLLSDRDVVMIDNAEAYPDLTAEEHEGMIGLDLQSLVVIPLRAVRQPIGALVIGSSEATRFSSSDLRVFQSFSEQTSLKLEAARLLEQTERRAGQLATSTVISQYASSILDLNVLLPRIVDLIQERFGYDHVQVFLMDENDEYAVLRASTGDPGRQLLALKHRLPVGSESVIGQVTLKGEPVLALDTADVEVVHTPNPYLPNTRAEMAVPLLVKGQVAGALDVQANNPRAFDDDDVAILQTVAGQIAVAIDNARLFDQSKRRANEMSFLFSVTAAAAGSETLDQALQNVTQELYDDLEALSVIIYLPEVYTSAGAGGEISYTLMKPVALASGSDHPLSGISEVRVGDTENLIGDVAANRRPMIINNITLEQRYLAIDEAARSAVVVPLTSGRQLIGLVTMESARMNAFDNETLTLLLTLSGTLSAIVENQQLLEQVQQTNEQLLELDRLKTAFLANMSHELRTPLNSIIGFSRVILKGIDGPLTEMQEQDLSTIYNSGQHLLNLINDILDQAKIAANKMEVQPEYFDIKTVVDGVRSIGIGLVKDKTLDIYVNMESGMPQAYGDEFRTRQVLLNLVSNAAKFTKEGSITISAYTTEQHNTGRSMIRVDVADTGIGIAEEDVSKLFEAFQQIDSSLTRTVGGTGLGLPIAKSLVEMQGGEMFVRSEVNVGSTFSITIPIEPQPQADSSAEPTHPVNTGELKRQTLEAENVRFESPIERDDMSDVHNYDTELPISSHDNGSDTEPKVERDTKPDLMNEYAESNGVSGNGSGTDAEGDTGPVPTEHKTDRSTKPHMEAVGIAYKPQQKHILLVEDNPDMVDQFRRILQREGFDIQNASFPMEAEALASGLHPTIIIMDVNFANGEGWQMLQRFKEREDLCDIPVIVATLNPDTDAVYEAGAFRVISRPIVPETLLDAVHNAERDANIARILIIDDQPASVRLLEQLLSEHGDYRVFSAESGMEGISKVARRRPNLIILDLRMPEMDGFTVVEELRANPETATIPILVVTGDTLEGEEIDRLMALDVIYKSDISTDAYTRFIDGVKSHLNTTGER